MLHDAFLNTAVVNFLVAIVLVAIQVVFQIENKFYEWMIAFFISVCIVALFSGLILWVMNI